jgi:hypothetical protein
MFLVNTPKPTRGGTRCTYRVKLEALCEAVSNEIIFRTQHCEALPSSPAGFMCNKVILGGEVADMIDVHKKTLHLVFHPIVMFIMLLMKGNKEFLVIQYASMLLSPLRNCASGCISVCAMWQMKLTYNIWDMSGFKRSREALINSIVFT